MSETRTLIAESAAKLLAPFADPAVQRAAEERGTPSEVWHAVAESGLGEVFAGSDDPWQDTAVVLKASGRYIVPAPLAETVMAVAAMAARGVEPEGGLLSITDAALRLESGRITGVARHVPWGAKVQGLVAVAGDRLVVLRPADATVAPDRGISREPRGTLSFTAAEPARQGQGGVDLTAFGALMRAAQIAGCIEAVLDMTVQYARERTQFGKPIGSFQAVQHQLAIMAGQSAASSRIVDAAFDRIAASGADATTIAFEAAVAKARTSEAAGLVASIAHQAHGAMGFTDEHRLHYYTRRLWTWRSEFGSDGHWSAWLGRQVATAGASAFWPGVTAAG